MIPHARPLLPPAAALLPALTRADAARYYSNFGELEQEYRARLAALFACPVVTASSATAALTATLLALDLPKPALVACPSWTFCATPAAIIAAGHAPYFVDAGAEGVIDSGWLHDLARRQRVDAAVIVAPFGAPLDIGCWEMFAASAGIPIIIDAAAGFDAFSTACKPGKCPVVVSTHATKPFATGEGGFVACHDDALLERIRRLTNFGLSPEREIEHSGINGKLSEYHAAVGVAELDGWAEKRARWLEVGAWYRQALGVGGAWASSVMPLTLDKPAVSVICALATKGIQAKAGSYGCHRHKAYRDYPRTPMPVTERLIDNTLYLPCYVDMTREDVEMVAREVKALI